MKEIQHNKFSLFLLDKKHKGWGESFIDIVKCFEYIGTYDTLEEAQSVQKEYKQKTLILPSY